MYDETKCAAVKEQVEIKRTLRPTQTEPNQTITERNVHEQSGNWCKTKAKEKPWQNMSQQQQQKQKNAKRVCPPTHHTTLTLAHMYSAYYALVPAAISAIQLTKH